MKTKRMFLITVMSLFLVFCAVVSGETRVYNGPYEGRYLDRVAFPIGGMGAGMICLEGTGAVSHVSVRNQMDFFKEPCMFAAISIEGAENGAKVLEGPVPKWKNFGGAWTGRGSKGKSWGLPRFSRATFNARFPFGMITLEDRDVPLDVEIVGWSPFIPGDADNSSLPAGALEYKFQNPTEAPVEAVFSYHSENFMVARKGGHTVKPIRNGFILWQEGTEEEPETEGAFAVFVDEEDVVVDHCWFRGRHYDAMTLAWQNVVQGRLLDNPPVAGSCPGASLYVPFTLNPGETKTIRVRLAWYVPNTTLRYGPDPKAYSKSDEAYREPMRHVPWYAGRFKDVHGVASYWDSNYEALRKKSALFRDTFYDTDLPPEVVEAVAANLTILKSPTVLRQTDGRLWGFEGCSDDRGCCHGTCMHVWNYAQSIPHLFPKMERSLRQTEFYESQSEEGRQAFRSNLPTRPISHDPAKFMAGRFTATDGQLGGIMKAYRDWRISGDTEWLKTIWPQVKLSLDYCMNTWDPRRKGFLEEPQHNTYDIQFWGPNGMCTSFYLGALVAAVEMGKAVGDDTSLYTKLLQKGKKYIEKELFNGEYFYQKVQTRGLDAEFVPLDPAENGEGYAGIIQSLNQEGPKYQYGTGCLSDGVLGFWIAQMCGLGEIINPEKVKSHLKAVYKYNLKRDLSDHANPQRPSYALGDEGGLLLCSWPRGGAITIPFIYSNEVWTGIEYQVASHLILEGLVEEGLDVVRVCRDRYNGRVRNPFNEYECGHWYIRAQSSYGLIQALTGVRYDAVENTLYIDSRVGDDFKSFLSTATGFGSVGLEQGKPFVQMKMGTLNVDRVMVSGKETAFEMR